MCHVYGNSYAGSSRVKLWVEKRDCKISEGKEVETEMASASNVQGTKYII